MKARRISGYVAIGLLPWQPISWLLDAVGLIDAWPYVSLIVSCLGLLWVSVLARRPFLDQRVASDLNREANWAIPNLRDRQVANAHEEAGLHHDYGRWQRNVADKIAPFQRRFPTAHAEFMALAVHFPCPPGFSEEHSRLKGMLDLKVTRLRALARRIQESGWLE